MARIQMTGSAKVALYFLRIYLIFLLVLIVIAFVRGIPQAKSAGAATQPTSQPATAPSVSR